MRVLFQCYRLLPVPMPRLLLFALVLCLGTPASAQVTGLSGWNIYLDPGHSQNENQGAYGYAEAHKVLRVGLALQEILLTTTDIDTVYISRTNDSQQVSLSQRVDHANSVGAAYYHSIHSNAAAPSANSVFVLWPQRRDGSEGSPNGGKAMAELMGPQFAENMRIPTAFDGAIGECDFYGVSSCRTGPKGARNFVQSFTNMASSLSEAGFHTNPTQNARNMNAAWKRLEAKALYWAILDFHGLSRPVEHTLTGIISDIETGQPLNGARITVGGRTYTTDTFASLFSQYSNDPDEIHNGFYYLEDLPPGTLPVTVEADDYASFSGEVTLVDTALTFFDVQLISEIPPFVEASSPEPEATNFRIIDNIVLEFSRQMDQASVEAAFSIDPVTPGTFSWSQNDTRLLFNPDTLAAQTDYTITIAEQAEGAFGHPFDGNADGTGGDPFVLHFQTGFPDAFPPALVASQPSPGTRDVELDAVITLVYDEALLPSSVTEDRVRLEPTTGGEAVSGLVEQYLAGEAGVLTFFPTEPLAAQTPYRLVIEPGLQDLFGNELTSRQQVVLTTGDASASPTGIDDFEQDVEANWWAPQQSGTTTGIVTDSTHFTVDSTVVNRSTGSQASARLDYGWNVQASEWLLRAYLSGGPPREVVFDTSYVVQALIFGDGSGTRFRFAIDEQVPDAQAAFHEVSPWYTVDWVGWQRITWDITRDGTGSWLGNGMVEGALRFDSFQLSYEPGGSPFGTLYIDDMRVVQKGIPTATESEGEVPGRFILYPNYPNPFNPTTTIRFALPEVVEVTVRVYNAAGAVVATLVEGERYTPGAHELTWDARGLPSGVYFCRIDTGRDLRAMPMVLVK